MMKPYIDPCQGDSNLILRLAKVSPRVFLAVLKAVGENSHITQEALKKTIGKSISTVKRLTISLQKKGILVRKNGKRDGYWEVT